MKTLLIDSRRPKGWIDNLMIILLIPFLLLLANDLLGYYNHIILEFLKASLFLVYIFYSVNIKTYFRKLGSIELQSEGISIEHNELKEHHSWGEMKDIKIIKGCKAPGIENFYQTGFPNYVSYIKEGKAYNHEFLLESKQKHKDFDAFIEDISQKGIEFHYSNV